MAPLRDDYILRALEKVAKMLRAAMGLKQSSAYTEALQELERAEAALLGESAGLIAVIDAATAASLIRDPQAIALYAKVLAEKADVLREAGLAQAARAAEERARDFAEEARRRGAVES